MEHLPRIKFTTVVMSHVTSWLTMETLKAGEESRGGDLVSSFIDKRLVVVNKNNYQFNNLSTQIS